MEQGAEDIAEENLDDAMAGAGVTAQQAQAILNNLTTVYFDYDESTLSAQETAELQKIAAALKVLNTASISIEGHCDDRGSNEYNLALGDRRARSVYEYLTNLGVDPSQLDTTSYGEERPAVSGMSESAWAKNRRAELVKK
ncbi:MAG: peptidoglycan-associated lipoprotein Pal [Deltaproteobacteria bacterium]|nr:peptidoglycan-associated lipoprotein Pal [Deltaproteobacteria bacterium]